MSRYLLGLSIALNSILLFILIQSGREFLHRVPFDMEDVRKDFRVQVRSFIMRACIDGTEYPPEYRQNNSVGWNEHSPNMFCEEVREQLNLSIERSSKTLGTGIE